MKLKFTPAAILLFLLSVSKAQSPITLTSADMPAIGFTATFAVDTPLVSVNYGNAGANQVYNFSSLSQTHALSLPYESKNGMYSPNAFASANQALSSNGSFVALDSSSSKYQAVGLEGYDYGVEVNTPLSPAEDLYHFPTQYQSSFTGNWGFYQAFPGSLVGGQASQADSVREIYTDHFSSLVDGWGKVITPVGSYRALRIKRIDTTVIEVDAYYPSSIFSNPSWHNESTVTDITTEYSYVAKETKGAVVSFTYDSAGNMKAAQYSLIPPAAPQAGFSYVTGPLGLVTFTDTSEGYPTRYHWSFGDGDTSSAANPTHTYATNGTYYVCETVYNAGGSTTTCDSVHITNIANHVPPVAVNVTTSDLENHKDTINTTSGDYSPTGDAFCVTRVYGSTDFTVLNCNDVIFTPANNTTGADSCWYVVCNTNQPTLCDTAVIVVDVTAPHQPPVAVNVYDTVLQPAASLLDATAGDSSPSGDVFCITSVYGTTNLNVTVAGCSNLAFSADSTFTGNDTIWYVICNVNQPTLCDTAAVFVTVEPNPALLPVTSFNVYQQECLGIQGVNASTNADSLVWSFTVVGNILTNLHDTTFTQEDTAEFAAPGSTSVEIQVCLATYNKFGASAKCDSIFTICEGITELTLPNISLYPNPANTVLTVDMRNNTGAAVEHYTTIGIYNVVGQLVKSLPYRNSGLMDISVTGLPAGLYLATIVDENNTRATLGRFTVMH